MDEDAERDLDAQAIAARALADQKAGRLREAVTGYEALITLRPGFAPAHNNLGAVWQALGDFERARACHEAALAISPGNLAARINLGAALQRLGDLEAAVACYRAALEQGDGRATTHANLGLALECLGYADEALGHHEAALAMEPRNADFHNNLALSLVAVGRLDEAVARFESAIALRADLDLAHTGLGIGLLLRGEFGRGWREYEWRLRGATSTAHRHGLRRWDGAALDGRAVLLQAEQGAGDAIQFVRYAARVAERGGRVVLACRPMLAGLLASATGVERVVGHYDDAPEAEVWAPLLSVPGLAGTTLETIPAAIPYLSANPAAVRALRERLGPGGRPKVGVVWRGSPDHRGDRVRSMGAADLAKALQGADVDVVSLQVGATSAELSGLGVACFDAGPELADFAETAAVIGALDLVISVDTAVAHLAGALGVRVWTMLPFAPDWRWLLGRSDSPWYPSMTLYRQTAMRDWSDVLDRVGADLRRFRP
jgi:tetratricopeptide (TPR) repeat protein